MASNNHQKIEDQLSAWLSSRVSQRRFRHSLGVLDAVTGLARHYGADRAPLRLAALLHDCAREMPAPLALLLAKELALPVRDVDCQAPVLLHGRLAAAMAGRDFGLSDPAMASAVIFHTAGHPQMSFSDKLFFLADHIEPGRGHERVEELRPLVFEDIDRAMLFAIECSEIHLAKAGGVIDPDTVELKAELLRQ